MWRMRKGAVKYIDVTGAGHKAEIARKGSEETGIALRKHGKEER